MAGIYRLTIDQGTTVRIPLRWMRDDEPVDLTGATARMEIRTTYGGELLARLDTENGGLVLGGEDGTIQINIPPSMSSAWTVRTAVYDIELVEPNGDIIRLLQGAVVISPEVTTGG